MENEQMNASAGSIRRGPGRPRKNPPKTPSGRGPGRPRKNPPKTPSGRGPGRPRKVARVPADEDDNADDRDDHEDVEAAPQTIADGLIKLLPVAHIGSNWSQADEDALVTKWQTHPLRGPVKKHCEGLRAWCIELRLWGHTVESLNCLPTDIISPRSGMFADSTRHTKTLARTVPRYDGSIDQVASCLWSMAFCRALYKLVSHHEWRRQPSLLRLAIEYTVICATDDRRPWDPSFFPYDRFLEMFTRKARENKERTSPESIHTATWSNVKERLGVKEGLGMPLEPWWSRLFSAIEDLTAEERRLNRQAGRTLMQPNDKPFIVRTSDLECLAIAIGKVDGRAASSTKTGPVQGPGFPTLESYAKALDAVWLDVLRKAEQDRRDVDSAPATDGEEVVIPSPAAKDGGLEVSEQSSAEPMDLEDEEHGPEVMDSVDSADGRLKPEPEFSEEDMDW